MSIQLTATLTGTPQQTPPYSPKHNAGAPNTQFNVTLAGPFTATAVIQRSIDNGATWLSASVDGLGTPASFTAPATVVVNEPEAGVLYRVACTAFTSGSIAVTFSQ